MKLSELKPSFLRCVDGWNSGHYERIDWIIAADGIVFLCPVCFVKNKGPVGTHSIICWRPRVPDFVAPKPGRWEFHGTGYNDLTLIAGSSSIQLPEPCKAHFFIKNGNIE